MRLLALPLLVALAACGTPQERCINRGTKDLQTVNTEIARIQTNIDRGYAIHRQQVPYRVFGWCRAHDGTRFHCWQTEFRWVETPVSIDPEAEQRKVDALKTKLPALREEAEKTTQTCQALHPE